MQSAPANSLPASESQAFEHIVAQLRRLKHLGCPAYPKTSEAVKEHIRGLADIPPDLLELAIDRWIAAPERATDRFFPFPGALRQQIQGELDLLASERMEQEHERMRLELIARGVKWQTMPSISRDEAALLLTRRLTDRRQTKRRAIALRDPLAQQLWAEGKSLREKQLAAQLRSGGLDAKSARYAAMDIMADLKVTPEWRELLGNEVADAIDDDLGDPKTWEKQ